MTVVRQIEVNVVVKWLSFAVQAAMGILLVPFLIRELGRDMYGLSIILGVVVGFAELADLGLRTALGRHLSESLAVGDAQAYNRFASTAASIWLVIAFGMATVCIISSSAIVAFLGISEDSAREARLLFMGFGSVSILCAFVQPLFTAIISSHNRFDIISKLEVGAYLISAVLLFLVLGLTDFGIFAWAGIMLASRIGVIFCKFIAAKRLMPSLEIRPKNFQRATLGRLFALSSYLFLLQVTNLLSVRADPLILTRLLGSASLALYTPGQMLSSKLRPLVMVLAEQLYPVATAFEATGKSVEMRKILYVGTRLTVNAAVGVFAVIGVFSESICRVWLEGAIGDDYRIAGYVLLCWSIVDLAQAAAGSQWPVLIAKNRIRFLALTQICMAVINIVASIWLVKNTNLGVLGVMIPTVVVNIVRRVYVSYYVARISEVPYGMFLRHSYLRPAIIAMILLPFSFWIETLIYAKNLFSLGFSLAPVLLLFALLFYYVGITREERIYIANKMRNILKLTRRRVSCA